MVVVASTVSQLQVWAEELLANVNESLATTTGGAIERAFVSPGVPVLDCCPQLTVDVRGVQFETTSPQNPVTVFGHKGATASLILSTFVVTIARCLGSLDNQGNLLLPPPAAQQVVAGELNEDVFAAWNGIQKALKEGTLFGAPCMAVYMDPATPLLPSGGCAGWLLQLRPAVSGYTPA